MIAKKTRRTLLASAVLTSGMWILGLLAIAAWMFNW
jgi:hypothetical protein